MNSKKVQSILLQCFLSNATATEIKDFLREVFDHVDSETEIEQMYDFLCKCEMSQETIEAILEVSEWQYIKKNISFLGKYIYLLYLKTNKTALQKYYFQLLYAKNDIVREEANRFLIQVNKNPVCNISEENIKQYNNESILYEYLGEKKEYSIYSFSYEIGLNMTLLKTPYGAVIFDCGAKVEDYGTKTITPEDIKSFLGVFGLSVDDVVAVVISHAHLDHYGSISNLVKAGIDKSKIYIENETKRLIYEATNDDYLIDDYSGIDTFYYPNKAIEIIPFKNGHIWGSNGYIVHFDNQNVVYTGDFCLHDQPIVKGLRVESITEAECIKKHGISCLITETTYGTKDSVLTAEDSSELMRHFVDLAISNNYKVFIPSFAIGRSQEIAFLLKGRKIIVDGLAVSVARTYQRYIEEIQIFDDTTHFASKEVEDKLRNYDLNDVIIASSGMVVNNSTSYNYILDFLRTNNNVCIIKSGFISSETAGNSILKQWQGEENILLDIPLSAHASKTEIIELINNLQPQNVVLIHGDGLQIK